MPMPKLDPSRYVEAVLADPSHMLPLPGKGSRLFRAEGEIIDLHHPFYACLMADGSLKRKPGPAVLDETPEPQSNVTAASEG